MVVSDGFGHELGTVLNCHKIQEHRFLITLLKCLSTYLWDSSLWDLVEEEDWRGDDHSDLRDQWLGFWVFGVLVLMFSCGR